MSFRNAHGLLGVNLGTHPLSVDACARKTRPFWFLFLECQHRTSFVCYFVFVKSDRLSLRPSLFVYIVFVEVCQCLIFFTARRYA